MPRIDVKQIIFDLAEHEKFLCGLGELTEEDEEWFNEYFGFPEEFENDDVYSLGLSEISELIFDFIDHCEEVGDN